MSDSQGMNKNGSNVDQPGADEEDIVNPWEVSTHSAKGVDYDKLISKFLYSFTPVFVHIRTKDNMSTFVFNCFNVIKNRSSVILKF